jgi:hypothetical protein
LFLHVPHPLLHDPGHPTRILAKNLQETVCDCSE